MSGPCSCFGGGGSVRRKDTRKRSVAKDGDHHEHAPQSLRAGTMTSSVYGSCRGTFSEDGEMSPRRISLADENGAQAVAAPTEGEDSADVNDDCSSSDYSESSALDQEKIGCLSMIETLSTRVATMTTSSREEAAQAAAAVAAAHPEWHSGISRRSTRKRKASDKPEAGCSLSKRDMSISVREARLCYKNGDGSHYRVRTIDYMKTKLKATNDASVYELLAVDMFKMEKKQKHVAKMMNLHNLPVFKHQDPSYNTQYPPLLIINIMLPSYAPSLFGSTDGAGWSIVQYYTLPPDFNPATFPNQKALDLVKRMVQNQKEADGSQTRDRLKILPRVVNVEEWKTKAPLTSSEYRLLTNYNEKPLLTRPQQHFHLGHSSDVHYFEIDLDVHQYAYVARTALMSFMNRLNSVIWETAFIIQGNSPDELPEQVLASARMYRTNFTDTRPFSCAEVADQRQPDGVCAEVADQGNLMECVLRQQTKAT
eukprot:gene6423-3049_t